ncbi:MAG TPA: DUF6516 family protein [Ginsengibacter sp.]
MLSTIASFSDCIVSFKILIQEIRSDLSKTKIAVTFNDGSVIFLREIIIQNVLMDYAYHWQKADGTLLIRWDNPAHYPEIATHPHHKHVGSDINVQPSYEQNLFQVLSFIKSELINIP